VGTERSSIPPPWPETSTVLSKGRIEEGESIVVLVRDSGVGMPTKGAARPTLNFGFGFQNDARDSVECRCRFAFRRWH
jgi:hypothetical protein